MYWPPDAEKAVKNFLFKTLKKQEFEEVYSSGCRAYGKQFTLVYLPSGSIAWGLSVSGKLGNAVLRNKLRRRIKEILRKLTLKLSTGVKAIIIPKAGMTKLSFNEIYDEIFYMLKKAKIVS